MAGEKCNAQWINIAVCWEKSRKFTNGLIISSPVMIAVNK